MPFRRDIHFVAEEDIVIFAISFLKLLRELLGNKQQILTLLYSPF